MKEFGATGRESSTDASLQGGRLSTARSELIRRRGARVRIRESSNYQVAVPKWDTLDTDHGVGAFYDSVSTSLAATSLGELSRFLNLGYVEGDDDRSAIVLPARTLDRASVKLVLEVIGNLDISGLDILDVGSGRGGTLGTLLSYFHPGSLVGVELSLVAAAFARRALPGANVEVMVGNAEALPFKSEAFDTVVNIESSHCYSNVFQFYAEVRRVLRPHGTFLYCDLLDSAVLSSCKQKLNDLGLHIILERNITANVLAACDLVARRRMSSFNSSGDSALQNFLAVPGSPTYVDLATGTKQFFIWRSQVSSSL
jgi:SAM-dependent methyltransferase